MSQPDGVIDALIAGTWTDPKSGKHYGIPVEDIEIAPTVAGREAELVRARHGGQRLMVVHDAFTREALGARVLEALKADGGTVEELVWEKPRCTIDGVEELRVLTKDAEALVAVGSGTVSDSVKYATYLDERTYSVFPTSPMNAYTTPTASVSFGGMKKSLTCHSAKGVFFDLEVLSKCPPRLISAAFADVICRTTSQVDWLLSHLLFGTDYMDVPYTLLGYYEDDMVASAAKIRAGEPEALALLTRVAAIMGLSTSFTGTTHVGSMAEHMISHTIDMFAAKRDGKHPGSSHGEQVGVATLTMARLQNAVLQQASPPNVSPTLVPESRLAREYGGEMAGTMTEATVAKALDGAGAERLNALLGERWDNIRAELLGFMRPAEEIDAAMAEAGCQRTGEELGLSAGFYRDAVRDARFIRDRYSMLDLADDSGALAPFVATLH
ncbi:MAG: iron-containing alcohol dehydrogenase [Pseudomonadota bacterium]